MHEKAHTPVLGNGLGEWFAMLSGLDFVESIGWRVTSPLLVGRVYFCHAFSASLQLSACLEKLL